MLTFIIMFYLVETFATHLDRFISSILLVSGRVLLLIRYSIFRNYLAPQYYKHLQFLVFGLHIGESSGHLSRNVKRNEGLARQLCRYMFPYHERHIVQTVHCVKHFAVTVQDFGLLDNYSTIGKSKICFSHFGFYTFSNQVLFHLRFTPRTD